MTNIPQDEPVFQISVVARMVGVHQQTLRTYERMGLVAPARSGGNRRLYSQRDVNRLLRLRAYMDDLGVNLAGAEVLLRLNRRVEDLQRELDATRAELARVSALLEERAEGGGGACSGIALPHTLAGRVRLPLPLRERAGVRGAARSAAIGRGTEQANSTSRR